MGRVRCKEIKEEYMYGSIVAAVHVVRWLEWWEELNYSLQFSSFSLSSYMKNPSYITVVCKIFLLILYYSYIASNIFIIMSTSLCAENLD